jgi:poly(hydroxyalkanoate) depolymerase family esterase
MNTGPFQRGLATAHDAPHPHSFQAALPHDTRRPGAGDFRARPRMKSRRRMLGWARTFERNLVAMTRMAAKAGKLAMAQTAQPSPRSRTAAPGTGAWVPGVALGAGGARRFRVYQPPDLQPGERLPLMVMLHGCGQDAAAFAASTQMNRVARRERFVVLYPEQDRRANAQGCWDWFGTASGRAYGEVELIMNAIDQTCLLHHADRHRVAVAGMSAGASMAALLVTRHPGRFKALVMHSGIPPGTADSGLSALRAMRGHRPTLPLVATTPVALPFSWPPLLVIHGDADALVSPKNGRAAVQAWADAGLARAGPARDVQRGQRHRMTVTDFRHRGRTVATLATVSGLAHAWSGGAAGQPYSDAQGPDASRMAWAFASRQFAH